MFGLRSSTRNPLEGRYSPRGRSRTPILWLIGHDDVLLACGDGTKERLLYSILNADDNLRLDGTVRGGVGIELRRR